MIDRDVALLPIPGDEPGAQGLAVVREPQRHRLGRRYVRAALVRGHAARGGRHPAASDETELDQTRAAILRLMAEGEKDEAISRRLSISVRTCRRHIADYMSQVGATSRFQAGVIAARAGQIEGPSVE